jgi:hypothetical protein
MSVLTKAAAGLLAVAGAALGLVVPAASAQAADLPNFQVGLQLIDGGGTRGEGPLRYTAPVASGGGSTVGVGDSNNFDPDGARLDLRIPPGGLSAAGLDFRILGQALDGIGRNAEIGRTVASPWASEGGGSTGLITDTNQFDPDVYRVEVQVRPLPPGVVINDVRLSIAAFDEGLQAAPVFTPWLSQGGGMSPYAFDSNFFDPDGFVIGLQVS